MFDGFCKCCIKIYKSRKDTMISYISDINKEAKKLEPLSFSHKGKTPLELLCTLLKYWQLIRVCLKFAKIFTINGTRERITEVIKLFDESEDFWVRIK